MLFNRERRRKPRVEVNGVAYVFVRGARQRAEIRNLSGSGIGVVVPGGVARGERVRVAVTIDGQRWLDLVGQARRSRRTDEGFEIGISLHLSDPRALLALEGYCRQVASAQAAQRQRDLYARRMSGFTPQPEPTPASASQQRQVAATPGPARPAEPRRAAAPTAGRSTRKMKKQATPIQPDPRAASAKAAGKAKGKGKQPAPELDIPAEATKTDPGLRSLYELAIQDLEAPPKWS